MNKYGKVWGSRKISMKKFGKVLESLKNKKIRKRPNSSRDEKVEKNLIEDIVSLLVSLESQEEVGKR